MANLVNLVDLGSPKGQCSACKTKIRYEYHTDDGSIYGNECISKFITTPEWMTNKIKQDFNIWQHIQDGRAKLYNNVKAKTSWIVKQENHIFEYHPSYPYMPEYYKTDVVPFVAQQLLSEGWTWGNEENFGQYTLQKGE